MASIEVSKLTELEKAIKSIVDIFSKYSVRLDNRNTLSIGEFKELVNLQLPNLKKNIGDLDEKMRSLDVNHDQELKFEEYWQLIGELAKEMKKEKAGKKK